jgi:hypothetical protein
MAKLTEEQAATLAELQALAEAPDEPESNGTSRVLNFTVDLGDEAQIARARKLGFLPPEEPEPPAEGAEGGEGAGGEGAGEEGPSRRGFFDK